MYKIFYLDNICKRYKNKALQKLNNVAQNKNIILGTYFDHRFCNYYLEDKYVTIKMKETVQKDDCYGILSFYIIQNNKVVEYRNEEISYTKKGFRYGHTDYVE